MKQSISFCLLLCQQALHHLGQAIPVRGETEFSHNLRAPNKDGYDEESNERELEWLAMNGNSYHTIKDDNWYSWYDKKELPDDYTTGGDTIDYIRSTDVCPGPNKKYTFENCPSPPDCSTVKEKWGKAKLCINRVPLPFNTDIFYIGAMKCIPWWENCDKCVCGLLDYSSNKCTYHKNHFPDDDRQEVDCHNLEKIKYSWKYSFTPYELEETEEPTNSPTRNPTKSPTSLPTKSPTKYPTVSPTKKPTNLATAQHTMNPSYSPSATSYPTSFPTTTPSTSISPSESPTLTPSESPTLSPSAFPSTAPSLSPTEQPTELPTESPTLGPSSIPTETPTFSPSTLPTKNLSSEPSLTKALSPSNSPIDGASIDSISVNESTSRTLVGTMSGISGAAIASTVVVCALFYRKKKIDKDIPCDNLAPPSLPIDDTSSV